MAKIKLGKTKDSGTQRKPKTEDAEIQILQKMLNEKEQPSFKKYLLQKGYSLQSIKSFEVVVTKYLKWLKKENIEGISASYNDIVHYIQKLRNTVKQRTIQSETNAIKHYYNYLKELDLVVENPTLNIAVKGVKRRILYNTLNKQELEKLYNDYRNIESDSLAKKRNEIIVSLLVYQGLNSTELGRLTTADLKLREGKIFINGTRRSNERTLKLESHQILDFMEYQLKTRADILAETGKKTDLLFTSFGRSTKFNNIISKFLPQLKKLNKKLKSVHQIRTSVIVHWLKMYNLREVQYMAGHRYVSSTESYLINDLEDLQEEIEKYHPIN
ncbi:integrase/recombinase XerD [Tenacibaculum sp. MAR_2009_124]|uniref:tyrosine-type recombinase/integrase n=1 Tax=Tenacibaculum sp. MAR_2009_124 TaxID=1250059 RepID=UPI00089D94D3|nr:tyrosine-type recombinase/integrase [Tenacibaculum sp. MAR_2009_124]SEC01603.1 integrase/recombinase XerD [Tenacibaculum sp. MAR_2009_124]